MKKRIDFFFFRNLLFSIGGVAGDGAVACQSIRLLFGINKPFSVIVSGKSMNPRILYVDSETELKFPDNSDVLFQAYIPDFLHLAALLKKILFQEKKTADFDYENELDQIRWKISSRENQYKSWDIYSLFELLIRLFLDIEPVTTGWNSDVREFLNYLDKADLSLLNIKDLLGEDSPLSLKGSELGDQFYRVAGIPLESFLFQHRVNLFLDSVLTGGNPEISAGKAGLGDFGSAYLFLQQYFGIDFSLIKKGDAFYRYYFCPEAELANFIRLE